MKNKYKTKNFNISIELENRNMEKQDLSIIFPYFYILNTYILFAFLGYTF
jgi:hypothetical protein